MVLLPIKDLLRVHSNTLDKFVMNFYHEHNKIFIYLFEVFLTILY